MKNNRHHTGNSSRLKQGGAMSIVTGFTIIFLIAMLGLVLDLGHLFIAKTELQNAADSCALAAAAELGSINGSTLDRATNAGVRVGNRNLIDLQREPVDIQSADITFSTDYNGTYTRDIVAGTRYARCAPQGQNVRSVSMWFMTVFGIDSMNVGAQAIAKTEGAVSCALPLASCTTNALGNNLGFELGRWYSGRMAAGTAQTGNYDWIDFKGIFGTKLSDTIAGAGQCSLPESTNIVNSQKGITGVAQAWNTRFGLYAGTYNDPALYATDTTGFAYTTRSWPLGRNAFGTTYPQSYLNQEANHVPYNPDAIVDGKGRPVNFPGNPSPSSSAVHAAGQDGRRIVVVPVIRCSDWDPNGKDQPVVGWACAMMLSPIADPNNDVQLEILRVTGPENNKPCNGVAGVPGSISQKLVR
ncbi:MAG: hypothetical protein HYS18_12570 [Burkholderiales bacterium]|nr:hypothetical protein [Burkholderiales bacterium]